MEILRFMAILLLIILVIVIGSNIVYKDDYAVLTGTVENGKGYIDYPIGFNKDNCVIISNMFRRVDAQEVNGFSIGSTFSTGDGLRASIPNFVQLRSENIYLNLKTIFLFHSETATVAEVDYNISYKIVLMKID